MELLEHWKMRIMKGSFCYVEMWRRMVMTGSFSSSRVQNGYSSRGGHLTCG